MRTSVKLDYNHQINDEPKQTWTHILNTVNMEAYPLTNNSLPMKTTTTSINNHQMNWNTKNIQSVEPKPFQVKVTEANLKEGTQ